MSDTKSKIATLPDALQAVYLLLEGWTPAEAHLHLRNELVGILETLATPVIYDRAAGTLRCPHCDWIGFAEQRAQAGRHGCGFRYAEDVGEFRDVENIQEGYPETEQKYDVLQIASATETYTEDNGRFLRLECRNCLGECALPEGLEIDFV